MPRTQLGLSADLGLLIVFQKMLLQCFQTCVIRTTDNARANLFYFILNAYLLVWECGIGFPFIVY